MRREKDKLMKQQYVKKTIQVHSVIVRTVHDNDTIKRVKCRLYGRLPKHEYKLVANIEEKLKCPVVSIAEITTEIIQCAMPIEDFYNASFKKIESKKETVNNA